MAKKIFISYRRDDAKADARDLHNRLSRAFGGKNVFMDVDNLLVGQRFDEQLDGALEQCDVLLAVIGPRWTEILNERSGPDERDYVRDEIAAALKRRIAVIPVLVDGAELPAPSELPDDIKDLTFYQKHDITHERFGRDVDDLVAGIKAVRKTSGSSSTSLFPLGRIVAALLILGVLGGGYAAYVSGLIGVPQVATPTAVEPEVVTEEMIKEAQTLLKELGYNPGDIDGKRGVDTTDAIKAFQRDMGTSSRAIFGQVDQRLISALRVAKRTKLREQRQRERAEAEAKKQADAEAKRKAEEAEKQRLAMLAAQEAERKKAEAEAKSRGSEHSQNRGWFGVKIRNLTTTDAKQQGLTGQNGTVIVEPTPNGPGAAAGLKPGDVVVDVAGSKIKDSRSFARKIASFPPGARLDVVIWRNGKQQKVVVTLGVFPGAKGKKHTSDADGRRRDPALAVKPGSGESFKDCDICPEMVVVPAGSFMMGSPENEKGRDHDEGPQRKVTIANPYAVGKYEVTWDEWEACVVEGGCGHKPETDWTRGLQPVMRVSWYDVKEYVRWLSKKTGKVYGLLAEAEWEYAARATTTTPFSTGKTITTDQANFNGNHTYDGGNKGEFRDRTIEVGYFKPNAYGLHDMHGNVWEWVEDCYNNSYQGTTKDGTATISGDCGRHVIRGGCWGDDPGELRSANRYGSRIDYRDRNIGFRVARSLTPQKLTTKSETPNTRSDDDGYVVVLASIPYSTSSGVDALKQYADLQAKLPDILAGHMPDVRIADLGSKGKYHRLLVGPQMSREDANRLCSKLRVAGYRSCWVTAY